MANILETIDLFHTYGKGTPFERSALKGVNFHVKKGEILGLIGHTGSGKSTLISHLNALLKPSSGKILVDGQDIYSNGYNLREVRFRVGLVFQYPEYQLFEETIEHDIAFGPRNMKLPEEEVNRRVKQAMEFVGLPKSLAEKSPFELSGGQKRRVAIAGVIAMEPEVLILDEPTAGLDPHAREEILSHIKAYHEAKNASIVIVTHSMEDIARTADRLVVMNDGNVLLEGLPRTVFSHADKLKEAGLAVPFVTEVLLELKNRGFDIDTSAYTTEQALDIILKYKESIKNA